MPWRLLDLYSGAGGAAAGYARQGFSVVGVDIEAQPRYPYTFVQADALAYLDALLAAGPPYPFDAVHASPPCQRRSVASKAHNGRRNDHTEFVPATRERLDRLGLPYVIENVPGEADTPEGQLRDPLRLCGTQFSGLRVIRHRLFETTFPVPDLPHGRHPKCYTLDKRKPHYGKLDPFVAYVQVTGGGNCPVAAARDAMGISWMTKSELNEAIPPAYTVYVGSFLLQHLEVRR